MDSMNDQEPRRPEVEPQEWLRHAHFPLEVADPAQREAWALGEGSRLLRAEQEPILQVRGASQAVWRGLPLASGQIDFRVRAPGGAALVDVRLSGEEEAESAYCLRLDPPWLILVRRENGRASVLARAEVDLTRSEWHDVTISLDGGRICVWLDGLRALRVIDRDPLPAGALSFGGAPDSQAEYADIMVWTLQPWADSDSVDIRSFLDLRRLDPAKLITSLAEWHYFMPPFPAPDLYIPFQVKVEIGSHQPATVKRTTGISTGNIPPDFIHSWAIDLRDIPACEFRWGQHSPQAGLDLDGGDRLYVVDSANQVLKQLTNADPDWTIHLKQPCGTLFDESPYQRIYLVLETSSTEKPRRLQVEGVLVRSSYAGHTGAEEALLADDDLNYDSQIGPLFWGTGADGKRVFVQQPWGLPESIQNYRIDVPPPGDLKGGVPGDGWHLVGKRVTEYAEDKTGFFSLAYYNERDGRLRLYLWNLDLTDATAYWVTVALQKRVQGGFEDLQGPLFMFDPRPTHWSTATTVIPAWPVTKWTFVEVPMVLYPMASDLPLKGGGTAGACPDCRSYSKEDVSAELVQRGVPKAEADGMVATFELGSNTAKLIHLATLMTTYELNDEDFVARLLDLAKPKCYQSVYEERFDPEGGMCNFRLRIGVRPLDIGQAELELFGKAKGEGIQIPGDETVSLATQAYEAFKTGADWYGKGESVHKKILELLEDQKKGGGGGMSLSMLSSLAAMGSSGWGTILAAVGVMISIFQAIFAEKPEPLRMAIELAIWGVIKGVVTTEKQDRNHYCYLPGRFSFRVAFIHSHMPSRHFDSLLPRYDRALGLFGLRYDPTALQMPVGQHWHMHSKTPWVECIFPCQLYDGAETFDSYASPLERHLTRQVEHWLPVVYNPYAEIVPVGSHLVAPDQDLEEALAPYRYSIGKPKPTCIVPKDAKVLAHEPWFEWIQEMSPRAHIAPEPDDSSFPTGDVYKAGSRMSILAHSPFRTAKFKYAAFHVTPLYTLDGDSIFCWMKVLEQSWGNPPTEERDVSNGVWLEVAPVEFNWEVAGTMWAVVVGEPQVNGHTYAFCQQTPLAPGTYRAFKDVQNLAVQQGWRIRFYGQVPDDGFSWDFDEADRPFPFQDVLYCWDIKYFYYGRTRKEQGRVDLVEGTASFRVPVNIRVLWKFKTTWNNVQNVPETDTHWVETISKSLMLHEPE
jgi:hypothetical protein